MEMTSIILSLASISDGPLMEKGFFVVAVGLLGVFMVLMFFFIMIIVLEKISVAAEKRKDKS